ncbi:MAG: DUF4301 family protein [Bacteroidales bacterium]|nr:DUF4301 family protein [Bacteroidales bacterium]MBN2757490.1 DUF4301 family protein [Bacteroidales bacterium]
MNFNIKDLEQFKKKNIDLKVIEKQIDDFESGFPYLQIIEAATITNGIQKIDNELIEKYIRVYNHYGRDKKILKFVPASGAATRMFKRLFEFYENNYTKDQLINLLKDQDLDSLGYFFNNIEKFAFYHLLIELPTFKNLNITDEIKIGNWIKILDNILKKEGLNYENLPKGLLQFHKYSEKKTRTSAQEHMVECALYATLKNTANLHFTVSPEHIELFKKHIKDSKPDFEKRFALKYKVDFSIQKSSTDTIAVDENNIPFRNSDGSILFRPGGHGALIENLNDLDADIIFIKNIDNVVPDILKEETIKYKKLIGGALIDYQQKIFNYLEDIEIGKNSPEFINEIETFFKSDLCVIFDDKYYEYHENEKLIYLKNKLNRPIRVCGMVKNEGEPGGGPFLAKNNDGSISLQIVESSQIDLKNEDIAQIVKKSTHFNPVDLICSVKDYKGNKFDLNKFIDKKTGFISEKSKNGKFLKALELPGLWNGAMSDWNTVFVEVPLITFNPVKTINDLLRKEHKAEC